MTAAEGSYRFAFDAVLSDIDSQRTTMESKLMRPARWRGPIRRELRGMEAPEERRRYASAFDGLVESHSTVALDVTLVLQLHEQAVGGGAFRQGGVRIAHDESIPPADDVPGLVAAACALANGQAEPPPLAAARLHLAITTIHPFADGSGRVARLLASMVLLRSGYRSTLLTAVEQHFHADPRAYGQAFRSLPETGDSQWLLTALTAMQSHSAIAAWILQREQRLRRLCEGLDIERPELDRALADFDLGRSPSALVVARLDGREPPLHQLTARMAQEAVRELVFQVRRSYEEVADEPQTVASM